MGKKLLFACLLLAGVVAVTGDSLFGLFSKQGETVTVPNLCGVQEESVALPNWAELTTIYRYDADAPIGEVIAQAPAAGSLRKVSDRQSCRITLTVSLGAEQASVPDLIGQTAASAAAALRNLGFSVREVILLGEADGQVAYTEPAAGKKLPVGSAVTLYVYKATAAEHIQVPNYVGMTRENALLELFLSGLGVGDVIEEASSAPNGTVIRQSPPAGSFVAKGTRIKLVISQQNFEE